LNNTAMEPYRAFIADKLNDKQQPLGFQAQSFFTGFGQTLANVSLFVFPLLIVGKTGALPTWVYASFFFGAFCSIASIWWSMRTTPEIPPSAQELEHMKANKLNVLTPFIEIAKAITSMPKVMWQLALVYLFQWYALFCYWQNASKSIALSVWNTTPANEELYQKAVSWTGLVNGWYNIVTFLSAFALVWFVKKSSPKTVHFVCPVLAAIGFLIFPFIENKYLLFPAITGFGVGWASMMGIPYLLVVSAIPKERYGVYMGIVNMMIVIPMILQNVTFGYILQNFLGNNAGNAIVFAGVLLILAALATLLIKSEQPSGEISIPQSGSH
ncbi:MAG TPA: MFS transporter, partial [Cytophagales bacterium]|nr:MFS transporter [Cytophagales bacterium]